MEINVELNIKRARRTHSGLHGHNGLDPETSLQLFKTYVLPILLYGMEILLPTKTHTAKMDLFQKKILKQILSLPKNAPDCAVYILTGIWPIELQIQYKTLIFYNNICNLNDSSLEKEIARRQLSIKNNNSKSWFMEIKKLLLKYDLKDPIILLENPVNKEEWKRTVNKPINFKWKTQLLETKKLYKIFNT
jgi:hypothetical protein